jgi:prenylcysteine alpha-carboxyl methylesterase
LPSNNDGLKPVVVFVTGGAWIIGYKAWGSLLGMQLAERDIIVACLDYRNFPQGTISDMVTDASQGISFVCNNISAFGGDPNRFHLIGFVFIYHLIFQLVSRLLNCMYLLVSLGST